jgi:hypothetical protein
VKQTGKRRIRSPLTTGGPDARKDVPERDFAGIGITSARLPLMT